MSSLNGKVGRDGKAKRLWKQYKFQIIIGLLLLLCIGFIAYDVWSTRNGSEELQSSSQEPVLNARRNFFETDPDLIWKNAQEQRQRETEEQLKLQNSAPTKSEAPAQRMILLSQVSSHEIVEANHIENESKSLDSGQHLTEQQDQPSQCTYVNIFASSGDSQSLTYDSNHTFCDIEDIDPESRCCNKEKRVERDVADKCNVNS